MARLRSVDCARLFKAWLLSLAVISLSAGSAVAAPKTIQLTAIDSYAPTALWVRVFIDYFILSPLNY